MSPASPPPIPDSSISAPRSASATTSFVLGLLGFVTCGLTGIIAVIFGHLARAKIAAQPALKGRGLAICGLIFGYLQVLLLVAGFFVARDSGLQLKLVQTLRSVFKPPAPTVPDTMMASAPFALIVPAGYDPKKPIPCVFWIHGYGASGKDAYEGDEGFYQAMANRLNMAFVGISGGRLISVGEDEGGHCWAEKVAEDQAQLDAILKLHADQITPEWGKCVLFGFSQGGKVAGQLLAGHPEKYSGLLMFSPGSLTNEIDIISKGARLDGKKALCVALAESPITIKHRDYYADVLKAAGVQVRRLDYPGVKGHHFPPDYHLNIEDWIQEVR